MSYSKEQIYKACTDGDIDTLNIFINSNDHKLKADISELTMVACTIQDNQIETYKFLIDSGFKKHDMFDAYSINTYLLTICAHDTQNKLEFFKHLFLHPEVRKKEDDFMEQSLRFCAIHGILDIFQYLCENFPNSQSIYRSLVSGATLINAATNDSINIIDYIVNNEKLNQYFNIHIHKDHPFRAAYENKNFEVIKYFIFDLNIDMTSEIKASIKKDSKVLNMFEMRKTNKELKKELDNTKTINRKIKI